MEMLVYNPQKGRLETIDVTITDENTTWFEAFEDYDIERITDFNGGLLIQELSYTCPFWVYDVSRADIGFSQQKAKEIYNMKL
jgi:hypothetical protein